MKAKINSGFGRNPGAKTSKPGKPTGVVIRSGFGPLTMGDTGTKKAPMVQQTPPHATGTRRPITPYGRPAGKRRMY